MAPTGFGDAGQFSTRRSLLQNPLQHFCRSLSNTGTEIGLGDSLNDNPKRFIRGDETLESVKCRLSNERALVPQESAKPPNDVEVMRGAQRKSLGGPRQEHRVVLNDRRFDCAEKCARVVTSHRVEPKLRVNGHRSVWKDWNGTQAVNETTGFARRGSLTDVPEHDAPHRRGRSAETNVVLAKERSHRNSSLVGSLMDSSNIAFCLWWSFSTTSGHAVGLAPGGICSVRFRS